MKILLLLLFLSILFLIPQFFIYNVFGQEVSGAAAEAGTKGGKDVIRVGGEDLIIEMEAVDGIYGDKLLKFQIPSTNYTEICPSNQCEIEVTFASSGGPSPDDDSPSMFTRIDFNLHDDITNADLTPAQKLFIEKFSFGGYCEITHINQIIQDKDGDVMYNCDTGSGSIGPNESSSPLSSLDYSYVVAYDTKSGLLKLIGKLISVDRN